MVKQVIIIRKDLNMRKGKIAAQASHASMKVFSDKFLNLDEHWNENPKNKGKYKVIYLNEKELEWMDGSFTKIVVSVDSEQELLDVYNKAKEAKLNCSLIKDSGLTEFGGVPTFTAVAIGPDINEEIDKITKDFPLL